VKLTRQELDDLLVDYLYDELDDAQRAAFESGLEEHPELAAEVEAHRQTRSVAAGLPSFALPPGLLDGVMAEAEHVAAANAAAADKPPGFFARLSRLILQPAFASAALAVVVIGVGVIYMANPPSAADPDSQRLEPVVATRPTAAHTAEKKGGAPEGPAVANAPEPLAEGGEGAPLADDGQGAAALGEADGAAISGLAADEVEEAEVAPPEAPADAPPKVEAKETSRRAPSHRGSKREAPDRVADDRPSIDDELVAPAPPKVADDLAAKPAATGTTGPGAPGAGNLGSASTGDTATDYAGGGGKKQDEARRTSSGVGSGASAPSPTPAPSTNKVLREVPIAVPSEEDANRAVGTKDRAKTAPPVEEPPPAPEDAGPVRTGSVETADEAPAERAASRRVSVECAEGYSDDDDAERAERERQAAEAARVEELWKRYDRYVASERWSDAEEVLDQLDDIPSQVARVRALRPQLARRRAAAERAAGEKQETTKQPATDSTYK